jgi:hypothetical protein
MWRPILVVCLCYNVRAAGTDSFILPSPISREFDAGFCSRPLSREAAAIIENDILRILDQHGFADNLSPECPFNVTRGVYFDEETWKSELYAGNWKCSRCPKTFRAEFYIDYHMHSSHVSESRAAYTRDKENSGVNCLADLCGLLGCPSLSNNAVPIDEADGETWQLWAEILAQDSTLDEDDSEMESSPEPLPDNRAIRGAETAGPHREHLHDASRIHHTRVRGTLVSQAQKEFKNRCTAIFDACLPDSSALEQPEPAAKQLLRQPSGDDARRQLLASVKQSLLDEFCEDTTALHVPFVGAEPASLPTIVSKPRKVQPRLSWMYSSWGITAITIATIAAISIIAACIIFLCDSEAVQENVAFVQSVARYHDSSSGFSSSVNMPGAGSVRSRFQRAADRIDSGSSSSSDSSTDDDHANGPEAVALEHALSNNRRKRMAISQQFGKPRRAQE